MELFNPEDFLILVVDDISHNLQVMGDLLDRVGYSTTFATSGKQAIERVKAANPDLILLDLMMPEMDGLQVCEQLQADPEFDDIPIIFLTASNDSEHLIRAFALGAVDYVTKPFKAPELFARIKTHLTLKHTRDELQKTLVDLVEAREAALGSARLKSQFLATMSHEIRTPMNAVLGMAELLLTTDLNPQQLDFVQTLQTSSEDLLAIVNDILDFSKLEAGGLRLALQEFDLKSTLENILYLFTSKATGKGLKLECNIDPEFPLQLIGDESRLRQILNNLIANAIKFTEAGCVTVSVSSERMQTSPSDPSIIALRFTVKDTGIGISATDRQKLFQSFSQVDATTTRQYGGTGLGLVICKQLVQLMDGEIGVRSQPGSGSEFWFTATFSIPDVNRTFSITNRTEDRKKNADTLKTIEILLVEDTRVNQKVLLHQLQLLGYQADCANHGREAIDKLAKGEYKIVLMDCQMPVLDGYQTTKILREREGKEHHLAIIGLTAHAMSGDREKCLAAGMDDYLAKPVSMEKLSAILEKWSPHNSQQATDDRALPRDRARPSLIDSDRLQQITGGDARFELELLQCFVDQTEIYIADALTALETKDAIALKNQAHRIKNGSANVAVRLMPELAEKLETRARENQLEGTAELLNELEQILNHVKASIN